MQNAKKNKNRLVSQENLANKKRSTKFQNFQAKWDYFRKIGVAKTWIQIFFPINYCKKLGGSEWNLF